MMKVVVVEDEALVRRGIVLTVDWAGVDCAVVGEAADGMEGLAVIRETQPDLIVTDIKMPRLDGLEMLRQLREEGSRAHVIILTAYSDFSYAQAALKLGAVDFLLKPFQDGELEEAVTRLRSRVGSGAPPPPGPVVAGGGQGKFKKETSRTLGSYLTDYRIHVAMELLRDCRSKVYEVAEQVGYRDITYFSSTFKRVVGLSPSEYQKQSQ